MAPVDLQNAPASAAGKSVFLIGITGYIGGTVFQKLLSLPVPPASFTVLVRDQAKADLLSSLTLPHGTTVSPLIGSLDSLDLLTKAASGHDVTINCAHADHVPGAKAIIAGLKQRKEATGHRPLFIHTSGTGTITDDARGEYPGQKIYTDLNPTPAYKDKPALLSIATLPDNAFHRDVDLPIVIGDASGWYKSYIILPSTIWGESEGELFDKGIANPFSQQIPGLIRIALDRGQPGMVGKGLNIWPHVHISDVADIFKLVYYGALSGDIGHGAAGYYFGAVGEYTLFNAVSTIGSVLVDSKSIESSKAHPTTLSPEEIKKYYDGSYYMGSNSRAVADRSKSIGWKPKFNETEDFIRAIKVTAARVEKKYGKKWE